MTNATYPDTQAKIRIPENLHDALRVSAALNRRSMNQEIIHRLAESFGEAPTPEEQVVIDEARAILESRYGARPSGTLLTGLQGNAALPTEGFHQGGDGALPVP